MKKLTPKKFLTKHEGVLSYNGVNSIVKVDEKDLEMLLEQYAKEKIHELDTRVFPDTKIFPPFV